MDEDLERGVDGNAIVADIAPGDRDIVVYKQKPSAFHGPPLVDYLVKLGVDGLIFTGTTTSGCVRAAVIDAFSYNFRCTVVEDGCFDRSTASHAINLCDMNASMATSSVAMRSSPMPTRLITTFFNSQPGIQATVDTQRGYRWFARESRLRGLNISRSLAP